MIVSDVRRSRHGRGVDRRDEETDAAPLLGIMDVAKRLGTSERFVRRLVSERRVPFHKVGKFVRFEPHDIDAWLAAHRVEATG